MAANLVAFKNILDTLQKHHAQLIAVSKTKPIEDIIELYNAGQKHFGENYVQELCSKHEALQNLDINWHFIGHLQSNKVKYIASFVHLIHSVDSIKLLLEINKQGKKNNRIINCLLQVYIATEETKFGMNQNELNEVFDTINKTELLMHVNIIGFMGMASFSNNSSIIANEFETLNKLFKHYQKVHPLLTILSMGMSQDYEIALQHNSNMLRIGSLLFGERNYAK